MESLPPCLRLGREYSVEMSIDDIDNGAARIKKLVQSGKPFFVGRNGTIEIQTIQYYLGRKGSPYPEQIREYIERNAGVFPATDASLDAWAKAYIKGLEELDGVAAGWYESTKMFEDRLLKTSAALAFRCPLRSLEPYYVEPGIQWTRALEGKRVCVVSSFTKSIQSQLKVSGIWAGENKLMLPYSVDWCFVQTGYSPKLGLGKCEWPEVVASWDAAVASVVEQVVATGATIALIGCGGLGMVMAAELKRRGVSAIVMGGAIQVLFGIKGRRWSSHGVISKYWNAAWIWPADDEIPGGANQVEGACYW